MQHIQKLPSLSRNLCQTVSCQSNNFSDCQETFDLAESVSVTDARAPIGVDDFCVNKKGEAIFQGGEVFEDYHGGQEYGQNQVFNLFNRVRILNNVCTPENHSNHVVPFDRLDLRANSTKRTSRGTRRTLPMRRPVPHGAGGVLHDRGIFLETLHINSKHPAPPLCVLTCPRRQL